MRRFFVWILVSCLLAISGTTVLAEGTVDLSGYSDADLLALSTEVQKEVAARGIEGTEGTEGTARLIAGTYVGGDDIPVGTYILTTAGTEDDYGIISLSSVNDPQDTYPSKLYEFKEGHEAYEVFITIEEGDTLILPFPNMLTIFAGVIFK